MPAPVDLKTQARARWLAGQEPKAIAAELGLDPGELIRWSAEGRWSAMRRAWWGDPRGAAAVLRGLLSDRVEELAATGELDASQADQLAKIAAACARLEREGYDLKAAAVEVGERLAALAAQGGAGADQLAWLGRLLQRLFSRLESEGA